MLKTIFRLTVYGLIAWLLSPVLNEILPLPTGNMVKGFLDPEKEKDRAVLQLLRYLVWIITIALLVKYSRPLFSFIVPTVDRLSVTKPFRRFQGVFAEVLLFVMIYLIAGLLLAAYPTFNKYVPEKNRNFVLLSKLYQEESMRGIEDSIKNRKLGIELIRRLQGSYQVDDNVWPLGPSRDIADYSLDIPPAPVFYDPYGYPLPTPANIRSAPEYVALFEDEQGRRANRMKRDSFYFNYHDDPELQKQWAAAASFFQGQKKYHIDTFPELLIKEFKAKKIFALIIAVVITIAAYFSNKRSLGEWYEGILRFLEHTRFGYGGSARFAGLVEEWQLLFKYQGYGLFMGRSLYNPFLNIGLEDDRHMLTVAGSRAGKGTSVIIPNLLLWKGSALVIDPKGTNAAVTANRRRKMGQTVHVIDPFGIVKDKRTASFNPFDALDRNAMTLREQINVIAEALVVPDPNQKERHWDDGAKTVIAGLIAHILTTKEIEYPTLSMLRDAIAASEEDQLGLWAAMSLNEGAGRLAKDAANRIIRGINTNEISSILSNADKHTEWLSSPAMQKTLGSSSFKFSDLKEKPTTIYLVIPPQYLETHNRFLRLFVNLAISQMSVGGRSKVPVLLMLDEFLALGKMEEVEKAFGLMAGYNLVMWPFVQDLGRLKNLYGAGMNAFIANSRAVQVFGIADEATKEFVSNFIGERYLNSMIRKDRKSDIVKLRTQTEIAIDVSADSKRQYILRAGKAPLLLEKVFYYDSAPIKLLEPIPLLGERRHGLFAGLYDKDPDYA